MRSRRERLGAAHLYLVCDQRPDAFLVAALRGGVDVVQLRIKSGSEAETIAVARRFARICAEHQALLILNDRPDLAAALGADGVHVGQEDVSVARARIIVGQERIIGCSTHTPAQVDAAADADYLGIGPVHETPTKPGRPAAGLELVRYAGEHAKVPWFAIGGIDVANVIAVRSAGARRIAVVRALTESSDPELTARELRAAILGRCERSEAGVGAA